jgi:hypothetical protein
MTESKSVMFTVILGSGGRQVNESDGFRGVCVRGVCNQVGRGAGSIPDISHGKISDNLRDLDLLYSCFCVRCKSVGLPMTNAAKQSANTKWSSEAPKYCQKAARGPG